MDQVEKFSLKMLILECLFFHYDLLLTEKLNLFKVALYLTKTFFKK